MYKGSRGYEYVGVTAVERLGRPIIPAQPKIPEGYCLIAVADSGYDRIAKDVTHPEEFREFYSGRMCYEEPGFGDIRIILYLISEEDLQNCPNEGAVTSTLIGDFQERKRRNRELLHRENPLAE